MNAATITPSAATEDDDLEDVEELDLEDEGDDVDDGAHTISDHEDVPPPRAAARSIAPRAPNPAHRQVGAKTETPPGTSWWLGKSREALAKEAEQRSPQMGNTKEGRKVRALPT